MVRFHFSHPLLLLLLSVVLMPTVKGQAVSILETAQTIEDSKILDPAAPTKQSREPSNPPRQENDVAELPEPIALPEAETNLDEASVIAPGASATEDATLDSTSKDMQNDRGDRVPVAELVQPTSEGYDILLRGPIHEAFAVAGGNAVEALSPAAATPPPTQVNERPPTLDEGTDEHQWIPGYWSWNNDLSNYVWVSGLWRRSPPGRTWIPGQWTEDKDGYRRSSGYWAEQSTAHVAGLPNPPASIDNGPNAPARRSDSFWHPGEWKYDGSSYNWTAGFWSRQYDNWIWQPSCYVQTPSGFAYVNGYWDFEPSVRGRLYVPVMFANSAISQPMLRFSPVYPLANPATLMTHLFVRSGYRTCYYGNYYLPQYRSSGYAPWYSVAATGSLSPMVNYYNWKYAQRGIAFSDSMRRIDNYYRTNAVVGASQTRTLNVGGFVLSDSLSVSLNSFDAIVRRTIAGQAPVRITAIPPIAPPTVASQLLRSSVSPTLQRQIPNSASNTSRTPATFPRSSSRPRTTPSTVVVTPTTTVPIRPPSVSLFGPRRSLFPSTSAFPSPSIQSPTISRGISPPIRANIPVPTPFGGRIPSFGPPPGFPGFPSMPRGRMGRGR